MRDIEAIQTEYNGVPFRSRTEARWAVFFDTLGIPYEYEKVRIALSTGDSYLPDFYLPMFDAWFEVKAESDDIVTEEAARARQLAADNPGTRVWLAIGQPKADAGNILTLEAWPTAISIKEILAAMENRFRFLEDRRDDSVYWLHAEYVTGDLNQSFMIGGPGVSTDHDRLPLLHRRVRAAYDAARAHRW